MNTAKDMYKVYSRTSTVDLIKNRNRKYIQWRNLTHERGYWAIKERNRLQHMINQIDAVIAAREAQQPLF